MRVENNRSATYFNLIKQYSPKNVKIKHLNVGAYEDPCDIYLDWRKYFKQNDSIEFFKKMKAHYESFNLEILDGSIMSSSDPEKDTGYFDFTGDCPTYDNPYVQSWFDEILPEFITVEGKKIYLTFDGINPTIMMGENQERKRFIFYNATIANVSDSVIGVELRKIVIQKIKDIYNRKKAIDDRIKELEEKQVKN